MIDNVAFSRLGRLVEIFDLLDSDETREMPPDAMFVASPNVITLSRGWVHASCRSMSIGEAGEATFYEWDMQFPLDRWVDLTVNVTQPNSDRDLMVDE